MVLRLRVGIEVSVEFLRLAARKRDQELATKYFVVTIANRANKILQGINQARHLLIAYHRTQQNLVPLLVILAIREAIS